MKKMRNVLRWAVLLWKRLYKKPTFLLLLVMIPLLVFSYGLASQEESGVITIALASRSPQVEPLTRTVWQELQESQLVLYVECESPEAATEMVRRGDAKTAWIFEEDLEHKIYDFIANRSRKNAFLTIIEPEDRVMLKLLREVLSGTLFPHCSRAQYLTYLRENAPELDALTDAQLLVYYENAGFTSDLFVMTDIEGNVTREEDLEADYLLSPVRGMLAVVVVLAGLATAMYYIRDVATGTFTLVPQRAKPLVELGCQLISIVNVLLVVLLSLALTGQSVSLGRELLTAGLYGLCVAAFSMMVRRLTGGIRGLGMVTPILVVVMLTICPVFFDLGFLRQTQLLLPPTYFVTGAYNGNYLWYMGLYTLAALAVCWLLDMLRPAA